MELYNQYRPTSFKQVFGQDNAVKQLTGFLKLNELPRQLLFTGPSGTGKTTLARILRRKLDCGDRDFSEINCADFRGIDTIREIRGRIGLSPIGGKTRIYLIDEAHKLSNDAQNAMLKLLEDMPSHAYIFLATTESNKLLRTIKTRCTEIRCKGVSVEAQEKLLAYVLDKISKTVTDDVRDRIIATANGSARKALVILHQVLRHDDEEDQISAIDADDDQKHANQLFLALMNPRTSWPEMSSILKGLDEEPEGLRQYVLACATNEMLNVFKRKSFNAPRAYLIALAFSENFYDSKKAGLVASCYEVVSKNATKK